MCFKLFLLSFAFTGVFLFIYSVLNKQVDFIIEHPLKGDGVLFEVFNDITARFFGASAVMTVATIFFGVLSL